MKRRTTLRAGYALLGILLAVAMLAACAGCATTVQAQDLMEGVTAETVPEKPADEVFIRESMGFSLSLLQAVAGEEAKGKGASVLLSPLSVQYALAMAANGAKGQTQEEMLSVLAGGLSMEELNAYLHTYCKQLQQEREKNKVQLANSIWYRDDPDLTVEKDFLQTNANYYGADAFKAAFDKQTVKEINNWISEHTDGLIDEVVKKIEGEDMLFLVNTVLFDAEWQGIYMETNVQDGVFTSRSGEKKTVPFLYSGEDLYFDDGKALGFRKKYAGGKFSFVALLPNEGTDVFDYVASLSAEGLLQTLKSGKSALVYAAIPKFESAYEVHLQNILTAMGMPTAFDASHADFTDMATCKGGGLYIGDVLHKTFIAVDERGTKAGAATVVEMASGGMGPEEFVTVTLDRPFVYLIMDNETNLPLFIGVQTDMEG
ncbi:MAG: serpin family protein [Oscillospiraceae bacterium]|nr:serpin family protein [Oscillospiraceae bacterium]